MKTNLRPHIEDFTGGPSSRPCARLLLATLLPLAVATAQAAVHFVRTNGNDALPGESWAQAKQTLGATIAVAAAGDDIWVAHGIYPERVMLKPGLALHGGFNGTETHLAQRDWSANVTVIYSTNGPVVTITNADQGTRLDGFTVTGGIGIHGGGIKTIAAAPVIANNTVKGNITDGTGAGISVWLFYVASSTNIQFPLITNNTIVENQAINDEGDGAGIGVVNSSPVIVGNVIARNTATRNGGGIACWRDSRPIIANNFILANSASYDELTLSLGGGAIFASATDFDGRPIEDAISAPVILNNVIAANGADGGGGIAVIDSILGAATIGNNTIVANNGSGIYWANTSPTNENNIVALNTWGFERGPAGFLDAVIRYNNVHGNGVFGESHNYKDTPDRTGTLGNISADPQFANRAIGNFHLQPGSPCLNAGLASAAHPDWPDIDGQARVQGPGVDLGADESNGTAWNVPTPVVYVSTDGNDADGLSWATAKRNVTNGIALAAQTGGEVWVAQGRYSERATMPAFVSLLGGFAGNETNSAARNPALRRSVLDGRGTAPVVYFKNAGYRVSALDGFTVEGGGTYFQTGAGGRGGGVYCRVSGPVIANSLIQSNSLGSPFTTDGSYGGGIYCYLGHAVITNNLIQLNDILNTGDGSGGGIYCKRSMPLIVDNLIRTNRARSGSAIYTWNSQPQIRRNRIEDNWLYQPMPYNGSVNGAVTLDGNPDALIEANTIRRNVATFGAGLNLQSCETARVFNNVIADNLAWNTSGFSGGTGGGLYCILNVNAAGNTVIANNTFVGNTAPPTVLGELGGGIAVTLFTNGLFLINNIVASNSSGIWRDWRTTYQPVLLHDCVINTNGNNYLNLSPGAGDFSLDPKFVNRAAGDFRLMAASPCVDAGTNRFAPVADFEGIARPLDGNANGAAAWDVGASEFVHPGADTDGDVAGDAAELIAGTNPTDPASVLRLSVRLLSPDPGVSLVWPSVAGRGYALEIKAAVGTTGGWQTAVSNLNGSGVPIEWRDLATEDSSRFYRLRVTKEP